MGGLFSPVEAKIVVSAQFLASGIRGQLPGADSGRRGGHKSRLAAAAIVVGQRQWSVGARMDHPNIGIEPKDSKLCMKFGIPWPSRALGRNLVADNKMTSGGMARRNSALQIWGNTLLVRPQTPATDLSI